MLGFKNMVGLNFVYLLFCIYMFVDSLLRTALDDVAHNFGILLCTTLSFFAVGWVLTILAIRSPTGPYSRLNTLTWLQRSNIVIVHTLTIISVLSYLNIVTAMIILYFTTGAINYTGMLALPGALLAIRITKDYVFLKSLEFRFSRGF